VRSRCPPGIPALVCGEGFRTEKPGRRDRADETAFGPIGRSVAAMAAGMYGKFRQGARSRTVGRRGGHRLYGLALCWWP